MTLQPHTRLSSTNSNRSAANSMDNVDLEDRNALRRIPSLSTELADVSEVEYRQLRLEQVVLVGMWTSGTAAEAEQSLAELAALAHTAGAQVLDGIIQRRDNPDPATYIGEGKVAELRGIVAQVGADTVICDGELSQSQLRQLEQAVGVKVIDRTAVILDIFAQHARSREGKAQVELAQLEYLLPRLRGWGGQLSRQVGGRVAGGVGIGGRGPGETKLEIDRRRIGKRIAQLRRQIRTMDTARKTQRRQRRSKALPAVVLAGYTNAGKSSLLNALTGSHVLVEDALFATLDPTVRRIETETGREYTLADTVGFVRHLPHQLVEAFRSTLEEVADADLILHIVDASHPDPMGQISAVRTVLAEIDATKVSELIVVNKVDIAPPETVVCLQRALPGAAFVSVWKDEGLSELRQQIAQLLPHPKVEVKVLLPYDRGDLLARIHDEGVVSSIVHRDDGTHVAALVEEDLAAAVAPYLVDLDNRGRALAS